MKLPTFTDWTSWSERDKLASIEKSPGVYLLAVFSKQSLVKNSTPKNENVVYIGETCAQTLKTRLKHFEKSATTGKPAHAGGVTFHSRMGGDLSNLYVAVQAHGERGNVKNAAYIRFVERYAIWEYTQIFGKFPKCNKK
jgi:hypothetical protein